MTSKRVIQQNGFVFASYCTLARIFIAGFCSFVQFPFRTWGTGCNAGGGNSGYGFEQKSFMGVFQRIITKI